MDDIHGLKPFIIMTPNWKLALLAALLMIALAALAWWWARRPKPVAAPERAAASGKPAQTVREQLDTLKGKRLAERGRVREFHGSLSAIVRGFLGTRYGLPGRRLTTTELLAELERRGVERATYTTIERFLVECDLAKFAEAPASQAEMEVRLGNAYHLVESLGDAPTPFEADDENPEPRAESGGERADVLG